jgi:hypothetical protein
MTGRRENARPKAVAAEALRNPRRCQSVDGDLIAERAGGCFIRSHHSNGEDYLRDRKAQWQSLSVPFSFFFFVDCAQKRVHGSGVRQGVCLLGLETCWCYSREKLNAFSCFAVHSYAEAFEQNS